MIAYFVCALIENDVKMEMAKIKKTLLNCISYNLNNKMKNYFPILILSWNYSGSKPNIKVNLPASFNVLVPFNRSKPIP